MDLYSINTMQNQTNSCGFILNQYHAESEQFVWIYTELITCRIGPIRVDLYSINTMKNRTNSCGFILNPYRADQANSCGFNLNQYHTESDQFVWIYTQSIPCRIGPIRVDLYYINTMQNWTNSCGFILNQYHAESAQFVWIYTESIPCRIGPIRLDL